MTAIALKARPYGMAVNSKNVVFFVEFGANKVASIDGKTLQIREYPPPDTHRALHMRAHAHSRAMVLACSAASTG